MKFSPKHAAKWQVAVVGSGPSGCYVADYLTRKHDGLHVDIYEKLPVPFGLLRYGVAPDHPEVKNLEDKFKTLIASPKCTWIGNVTIGKDVTVEQLLESYSAVVVCTGASSDRSLDIPGEDLIGVVSARQFVNYYNTYPHPYGSPAMCPVDLAQATDAVIIGNGNVAVDVARVLASSYKYWCPTDMNCSAVKEFMQHNRLQRVHVVGRRGPEHSAFTTAEFRELTTFKSENSVRVSVDPFDLTQMLLKPECQARPKRRLLELIHKFSSTPAAAAAAAAENTAAAGSSDGGSSKKLKALERGSCHVQFRYHLRPVAFLPRPDDRRVLGAVRFERVNPASTDTTREFINIPCSVAFKSVGYASDPDAVRGVPFDASRKTVENEDGRVKISGGAAAGHMYCAGWCKRGPNGVILHTMNDAYGVAQRVLDDMTNGVIEKKPTHGGKYALLDLFVAKNLSPISHHGLQRIWNTEKERGIDLGKRLEKIQRVSDMLDIGGGGKVGKRAHNRVRGIANARPDALMYLSELLDDDTDLSDFAKTMGRDMPRHLAEGSDTVTPKQL